MKDKVMEIVKSALGGASDNLVRANSVFGKMSSLQLAEGYGSSGRPCGVVWQDYKDEHEELKKCLAWVESRMEGNCLLYVDPNKNCEALKQWRKEQAGGNNGR
jgi:hypothetical protein